MVDFLLSIFPLLSLAVLVTGIVFISMGIISGKRKQRYIGMGLVVLFVLLVLFVSLMVFARL